ncbi:alanine racemase [Streptosporangium sp. NPDC051023]|uniref:alanine racemase n=1 Tax=Streptosporangium sp. NPDC051023 TaxID=3155410 RepID=UPI00344FC3C4
MFLDTLRRRNPALIEAAIALHQAGKLPANTYVLDLDAVTANARTMRAEADRLGLRLYAMTKQVGRNPDFIAALRAGGVDAAVAVDMADARAVHRAGMRLGHLGHLVQVPRAEADAAAAMAPEHWTVFSMDKAGEAAAAAGRHSREQTLLARVHAPQDRFYRGHEGGFPADAIVEVADELDRLQHARFGGITTFPALLFDPVARAVRPTPNLDTLARCAEELGKAGRDNLEINAPGTSSSVTFQALADAGATQVEPGHGLTGTTPLHALEDLPEIPAALYLTEVSHLHGDLAYAFGGGLYVDPVFPPYQMRAIVSNTPTADAGALADVEIPPPDAIDYYAMVDTAGSRRVRTGDSVVFGFRIQAFVTRAYVAGVRGVSSGRPQVAGVWSADGTPADLSA